MPSLLPLLLLGCHLLDDGYIENTCEGTPIGCPGPGKDDTNADDTGADDTGADDTGALPVASVYLYNLVASKSGSGSDYSYINGYAIAADGTWWMLDGQPWGTGGRGDLSSSALDIVMPTDDLIVAGNNRESTLDVYTFDGGDLKASDGNPYSLEYSVAYIESYPALNRLYVVGGGYISAAEYDATGAITSIEDTFETGSYSGSGEAREIRVHPKGDRLLSLEASSYAIIDYVIGDSGLLSFKDAHLLSGRGTPTNFVIHPDGELVFVRDLASGIYALGYDPDSREFSEKLLYSDISQGAGLALNRSGSALYATESSSSALYVFEIDPGGESGVLQLRTDLGLEVGKNCRYMEVSPDNTMLFVSCPEEDAIHVFSLDSAGIPTPLTVMGGQTTSSNYGVGPLLSVSP